ncbi:MAG TPA: DUF4328 domain-containing protein, partial [Mycobacterium sp.]
MQSGQRTPPPRLPQGYRWIAVRPGAAPPPRRGRQPLGPTPRYPATPRWGLTDQLHGPTVEPLVGRSGAPVALVRAVLIATMVALGLAAVVHIVRYALLLINRTTLLSPWVAWLATWSGRGVSALVQLGMLVSVVLLTSWLIGRRARAFAERNATDPRSETKMWLCCLLPVVNLVMAPVFVIELADAEG